MALPRSSYVQEGQEGVYHCYCRCVRRAFLCGFDPLTQRNFSHRKKWIVDRMRFLSTIFAIDVCAYDVLPTHYHNILRTRPDIVPGWSDREVAIRWLTLFPHHRNPNRSPLPPDEKQICALTNCPQRIAVLRKRLGSLSWFMKELNEFIARAANKEDGVKGRFWESRFKCQVLLDNAAIAACMVYVDLNTIRAGLAPTPEESDFSSIQERIRAWQDEKMASDVAPNLQPPSPTTNLTMPAFAGTITASQLISQPATSSAVQASPASWLCPIQSESHRRGILQMTLEEYFDLVDRSGRMVRPDKRGSMDPDLAPILLRIGVNPNAWLETITRFDSKFHLAAGMLSNLRRFADLLGRHWLMGIKATRIAFASSLPPLS